MPEYNVLIPCTMSVSAVVVAENKEAAAEAALNIDFIVELKSDDAAAPEIYEFETHRKICEGNYFYGCICDMDIEEA